MLRIKSERAQQNDSKHCEFGLKESSDKAVACNDATEEKYNAYCVIYIVDLLILD